MNHIVIIGFMDRIITKKFNMSVKEVFERFGEPFYRALETLAIKSLIEDKERKVLSLGAGLPIQEQNQKYLKELGTVIYLKGSYSVLKKRLEGSNNPLIEGSDQEDKIKKLLKQRDPVYARFADIQVETGVKPFEGLIEEIEEKLASYTKK